jgi:hypothetical protein
MSPEKIMTILLPCCLGSIVILSSSLSVDCGTSSFNLQSSPYFDYDHEAFVENHQGDKSLGAKLKKFPSSKSNNEDIPVYENIRQTESTRNKGGLSKENEGDSHPDLNDMTKYRQKNEQSKYGGCAIG